MPVIKSKETSMYYYKVVGDDMSGDRILDGDIVLIDQQNGAHPNDIVLLMLLPQCCLLLRRVRREGTTCILTPSNPEVKSEYRALADVIIMGRVIEVKIAV